MSLNLVSLLAPDADDARRLLEGELAKPAYVEAEPNIFERLLAGFLSGLAQFLDGLQGLGSGPGTLVLAVGAALVILVAVLLIKPRLNAKGRASGASLFTDGMRLSAADHRSLAETLSAAGNWKGAVAETLRAIIRSAEERVILDEQPGRTATEAATRLGGPFPSIASDVVWLAELFNETQYGRGRATSDDYRRATAIDDQVSSLNPTRPSSTSPLAAPQ